MTPKLYAVSRICIVKCDKMEVLFRIAVGTNGKQTWQLLGLNFERKHDNEKRIIFKLEWQYK